MYEDTAHGPFPEVSYLCEQARLRHYPDFPVIVIVWRSYVKEALNNKVLAS